MIIIISGINVNNDHLVNIIAGRAGFSGAVKSIDFGVSSLDIRDEEFRKIAGVSAREVERMLGQFILAGFKIESK